MTVENRSISHMAKLTPNPKKRDSSLPAGCKDLMDVLKPHQKKPIPLPPVRVNFKIRAHEVAVRDEKGKSLGVVPLAEALAMARSRNVDLVEIDSTANPPVCLLIDFGKYRHQQSRRKK